mmetsp:Transcript_23812/g.46790  ORF Transcript_23812/g.46790 Transcript_23812/m.46790 type:complete len:82 (+) Transcript_23812:479-724(+)
MKQSVKRIKNIQLKKKYPHPYSSTRSYSLEYPFNSGKTIKTVGTDIMGMFDRDVQISRDTWLGRIFLCFRRRLSNQRHQLR